MKKLFWKNISKTFFGKNICVLLRRANGGGLHTFGCFGNTSWPKHILRHEILKAWITLVRIVRRIRQFSDPEPTSVLPWCIDKMRRSARG